jgi:hypothetical protein
MVSYYELERLAEFRLKERLAEAARERLASRARELGTRRGLLSAIVLLFLLLTACAPATAPEAAPGGTLRIGQNGQNADLGTLDPHLATEAQDRALVDMLFNGLIRYKPGDATAFEPDLAISLPTLRAAPSRARRARRSDLAHGSPTAAGQRVQLAALVL